MAETTGVRERFPSTALSGPMLAALAFAVLAAVLAAAVGPGVWFFVVIAVVLLALVVTRPELGIAVFLSTFLVTYPGVLAGSGYLTINNVLGVVFLVLLAYRIYLSGNWWFVRNPELLLLAFIAGCYGVSSYFNGPEAGLLALIGPVEKSDAARLYLNRVAFVLFFVNFVRTAPHIRLVYALAIGLMVAGALGGVWSVLSGAGLYGYRATTLGWITAAAGNPNRLAMSSIIAIGATWYLLQQVRQGVGRTLLIAVLPLLVLSVFMTASRSGLLGLAACVVFILLDQGLTLRKVIMLAAGGLLALLLVLQFVPEKSRERVSNLPGTEAARLGEGAGSLQRRQYTFEVGMGMAMESPFLGVGIGNWEVARFMRDPARSTGAPHSSYLEALTEGGVFCLLGFLALFWRTWRNLFVARSLMSWGEGRGEILWVVNGARAGLVAFFVFSLFADLWQSVILFWLIGLGVVLRRHAEVSNYSSAG